MTMTQKAHQPGVVVELKNGVEHWWGGMMFPTAVCDAITKAWKGKSETTAAMAMQARSQAALTAASKQTGKVSRLESQVSSLQGKIGDLEAEVKREQEAGEMTRGKLSATTAALAAETEGRVAERRAADRAHEEAQATVAKLRSDIGNLNERIARSEMEAAEQKSARMKEEAANQALGAELAGERERARVAAEEAARQSAEATRRFNEYKDGADRRHVEISARCEEARANKEAAVKALEEAQLSHAATEKEMANAVSDMRLEAEKAQWALETAKAAAKTSHEALERERDAYERKVTEQRAKKTAQKESIESLRLDKDNAEREALTLHARLDEAKKQAELATQELASFKEGRDRESQRVDSEVAERQEALRLRAIAETAAVSAREAEKYAREQAAAEAHTAKEAVQREEVMRRELERVQQHLAAKETAYEALLNDHSVESVQSTATTSSLEAKLEEKEKALSEAQLQNTTLRWGLCMLSLFFLFDPS